MSFRPGEIYWAFVGEGKRHPIVVVSREDLNRGNYVVGVQLTSAHLHRRRGRPNCVHFRSGQFGLPKECVARAESITYLERTDIDIESGVIGALDGVAMRDMIRSIGYVISAECEPEPV